VLDFPATPRHADHPARIRLTFIGALSRGSAVSDEGTVVRIGWGWKGQRSPTNERSTACARVKVALRSRKTAKRPVSLMRSGSTIGPLTACFAVASRTRLHCMGVLGWLLVPVALDSERCRAATNGGAIAANRMSRIPTGVVQTGRMRGDFAHDPSFPELRPPCLRHSDPQTIGELSLASSPMIE
jgi:hypothetical protein